ncbi:MAG TPA: VWA domain-containing protein [Methyloceanibacter sp.]|nr:VWA domain-containing protein [Methyloceanibacter sp.]
MGLTKGMTLKHVAACAVAMAAILLDVSVAGAARGNDPAPCSEDAMIVFDASGSMAGNMNQGIATTIPRINEVRKALGRVLPGVTRFRRVGLITYGPGPYQQCNVELNLRPMPDAAGRIMHAVNLLNPAGKTPLAEAVEQAAEVLEFRTEPGVVIVLTDGEETCGGTPCALGKRLHAESADLTVHVIGFQMKNFLWTGEQSLLDVRCLAEETGGLYITAADQEELVAAFEKTLGCPMMSYWGGR